VRLASILLIRAIGSSLKFMCAGDYHLSNENFAIASSAFNKELSAPETIATNVFLVCPPYSRSAGGSGSCDLCADYASKSDRTNKCECNPGYVGQDGICTPCPVNTYQPGNFVLNLARACGPDKNQPCPTQQSSTAPASAVYGDATSQRAVDGSANNLDSGLSCAYTLAAGKEWWSVDLERVVDVTSLRITGYSYVSTLKNGGFSIHVGNDNSENGRFTKNNLCISNQPPVLTYASDDIICTRPVSGRYVFFSLPVQKAISLCEVGVFALECTTCPAPSTYTPRGALRTVKECECVQGFYANTSIEPLVVYDFTKYRTVESWRQYAAKIGANTTDTMRYFDFNYGVSGNGYVALDLLLLPEYNIVEVTFGNTGSGNLVLLINGIAIEDLAGGITLVKRFPYKKGDILTISDTGSSRMAVGLIFKFFGNSSTCTACPHGTFNNKANEVECFACYSGDYAGVLSSDSTNLLIHYKFDTVPVENGQLTNYGILGAEYNANINLVNGGIQQLDGGRTSFKYFWKEDAASGNFLSIPNDIIKKLDARGHSVSFWTMDNLIMDSDVTVLSANMDGNAEKTVFMRILMPWDDGSVYYDIGNPSSLSRLSSSSPLSNSEMTHWVFTKTNKDATSMQMSIFKNGMNVSSGAVIDQIRFDSALNSVFRIGYNGGTVSAKFQNKSLEDFRIYDKPLEPNEVELLYTQYTCTENDNDLTKCPRLCKTPARFGATASGQNFAACLENTFNDGSSATCMECPQNSLSSTMASKCTCVSGYEMVNDMSCTRCAHGKYRDMRDPNVSPRCVPCTAGKYLSTNIDDIAEDVCVDCPPGTYNQYESGHGLLSCSLCHKGTYNPFSGAMSKNECLSCPVGKFHRNRGATSMDTCVPCNCK